MIVCIIPARGGSKGIPGKNIARVCGKPLLCWSIEQALESRQIDEVCVATDSDAIAFTAGHYGVEVYHRSAESATDEAPSETVLREVLDNKYPQAELCVFLQATSPMREPHDIDRAISTLVSEGADSLFSCRFVEGYVWEERGEQIVPYGTCRVRRQDSQVMRLEENGSIYVFKPSVLRQYGSRLGGKMAVYRMNPLDSFQIDHPEDIGFIEWLMSKRGGYVTRTTATA